MRFPSPRSLSLLAAAALVSGAAALPSLAAPKEGIALYRAKCSSCHRLHPKDEFTADEWKKKLPEMARRAKLTPDELARIEKYLGVPSEETASAKAEPTPTPAPSHAATK